MTVNLYSVEVEAEGERRLRELLGAAEVGATVYDLQPGRRICPYHWHAAEEEWLLVVRGAPTLRTPDGERSLRVGDLVAFPCGAAGAHEVRNESEADVRVLLVSSVSEVELCVYPDSGKVGAWAPGLLLLNRPEQNLDYWDGEGR